MTEERAKMILAGDYMRDAQRVTEGLHHYFFAARRGDAAAILALKRWKNLVTEILGTNLEELLPPQTPAAVGPDGKEIR